MKKLIGSSLVSLIACSVAFGQIDQFGQKTDISSRVYTNNPPNAQEATFVFDIVGDIATWDEAFDSSNARFPLDLATAAGCDGNNVVISDIDWDVTINPIGDSWYSEASFAIVDPNADLVNLIPSGDLVATGHSADAGPTFGFGWSPGFVDGFANSGSPHSYVGGSDLDVDFIGSDGISLGELLVVGGVATLEFYESFDDMAEAMDANYLDGGSITFTYGCVPEPASLGLLALAVLTLLVGIRRR